MIEHGLSEYRPPLVGVDGCKSGWIAAFPTKEAQDHASPRIGFELFGDLPALTEFAAPDAIIAIDMPIGLPETVEGSGRGAEQAVRPFLGARQSSVFSIPSRAAVYADDYPEACRLAFETSTPPRKVSKQAFNIFPKIRELDRLLRHGASQSFHEVHPEFAFFRLGGEKPLVTPKKIKSRINPVGIDERIGILKRAGISFEEFEVPSIKGAGMDDMIDACACLAVAFKIADGSAKPYPPDPGFDRHGLPIAIWG